MLAEGPHGRSAVPRPCVSPARPTVRGRRSASGRSLIGRGARLQRRDRRRPAFRGAVGDLHLHRGGVVGRDHLQGVGGAAGRARAASVRDAEAERGGLPGLEGEPLQREMAEEVVGGVLRGGRQGRAVLGEELDPGVAAGATGRRAGVLEREAQLTVAGRSLAAQVGERRARPPCTGLSWNCRRRRRRRCSARGGRGRGGGGGRARARSRWSAWRSWSRRWWSGCRWRSPWRRRVVSPEWSGRPRRFRRTPRARRRPGRRRRRVRCASRTCSATARSDPPAGRLHACQYPFVPGDQKRGLDDDVRSVDKDVRTRRRGRARHLHAI